MILVHFWVTQHIETANVYVLFYLKKRLAFFSLPGNEVTQTENRKTPQPLEKQIYVSKYV